MSFWDTSDNEAIETSGEFESGANLPPIPANTDVLAAPDEAGWDRNQETGEDLILIRWTVLQPAEYAGRKIRHKIRVLDDDDKKADKAKRMLAAIDANAGGKLLASGEDPTDENLVKSLVNKPMILKLMVWKMKNPETEEDMTGNWVSAVSPRRKGGKTKAAPKPEPVDEEEDLGF